MISTVHINTKNERRTLCVQSIRTYLQSKQKKTHLCARINNPTLKETTIMSNTVITPIHIHNTQDNFPTAEAGASG